MTSHENVEHSNDLALPSRLANYVLRLETKNEKDREEVRQITNGDPNAHMNPAIARQEGITDERREIIEELTNMLGSHKLDQANSVEEFFESSETE